MISISIVSHGQFGLVKHILEDLKTYCSERIEVILTINIPEKIPDDFSDYPYPVKLIKNTRPKGFGANHNAAFKIAQYDFFCVMNPDIRLLNNPFIMLADIINTPSVGVVGPAIIDKNGMLQDSARKFPTPFSLLKDFLDHNSRLVLDPDWIAGMFMLFRRETYRDIQGFDEAFYLYCEDMDICARLRQKNYTISYEERQKVLHTAQRTSHKKLRYLLWHVQSLCRFFWRFYFSKNFLK